jgi:hypothetical protein
MPCLPIDGVYFEGNFDSTFGVDGSIWEIVAHPQKRNQLAIRGFYGGEVIYVIEPSQELLGEWVCKANQRSGPTN